MDAFICERGIALDINTFIDKFGNEALLKLKKSLTISTVDRITKIPKKTTMFSVVKAVHGSVLEVPKFCLDMLRSKKFVSNITTELSSGERMRHEYIGQSNPNQKLVVNHVIDSFRNETDDGYNGFTLQLMAGCHARDTMILMFDGTTKFAQDIQMGDQLMGDDSTPRNVLDLVRGNDTMYQITNVKNESYVVNGDHILCLTYTNKKSLRYSQREQCYIIIWFDNTRISKKTKRFSIKNKNQSEVQQAAQQYFDSINEDRIVEISVNDYLQLPKSFHKDLKGYKTSIDYPSIDLPIDPYMIGYWLGDGNANTSMITTQESSIIDYFKHKLPQYKCYLQYQQSSTYGYRINGNGRVGGNQFLNTLKTLQLLDNKHIPLIYKCNSRANRLSLLAGLLDADGSLNQITKNEFEFSQSIEHEQIIDDVIDLARSLGFSCYKNKKKTSWTHKGIKHIGEAWRICINGEGVDEIPTLSPRKQALPRKQIKDVLVSEITVTKLTADDYYGFRVDGNQRYLMSNFIVTHNCGKSYVAMDIISKVKRKTLIVVPNTYLLNQWVKLLTEFFPTATIGELYGKRKVDGDIIVGIINTVADLDEFEISTKVPWPNIGKTIKYMKYVQKVSVDDLYAQIGLTIFDESQMYVSKEFRKAFQRVRSRFTIGLSATPDIREDKLDKIHLSWVGPILNADELEHYSPAQDAFQSTATMIKYHALDDHVQFKIRDDGMMDYQSIIEALVNDPHRNQLLVNQVLRLAKKGHYVFVFSDRRSHLEQLYDTISELSADSDIPINLEMPEASRKIILYGGSSDQTIQTANDMSNIIFTTYQYSSTGVSIKKMDCLVLTTPRRSNMKQIINRVFRLGSDQTIERQIIDLIDMKMPIKRQHLERLKAYKERGSQIVYETHIVEQT